MCKFDAEINGAALELANEALSFVPAVERVLVKARELGVDVPAALTSNCN